MKLIEAKQIAVSLCYLLQPLAAKINIAGSIRRKQAEVKDIEIIALISRENRTKMYHLLSINCYWKKGQGIGRYMQWQHKDTGIKIDLFLPVENDYYRIYAIRTGSSEYSSKVIATAWVKLGWVGTEHGLRKRSECIKKGDKWIVAAGFPELPPVWASEQEFFRWLGIEYIDPFYRCLL